MYEHGELSQAVKPCPFCDSPIEEFFNSDTKRRWGCSNDDCPAWTAWFALDEWNTRPIEDKLNAVITALLPYVSPDMPPEWLRILLDTGDVDRAWEIKQRDETD